MVCFSSSENGRVSAEDAAAAAAASAAAIDACSEEAAADAALPPPELVTASAAASPAASPSLRSAAGWAALCLRWSGDSERLELPPRPATPLVQRRPSVDDDDASDAAPLVTDDAQLEEPQLLLLLADVLHAPLSASNARNAVADDEARRRILVFFPPSNDAMFSQAVARFSKKKWLWGA